jgi:hypothetical protein
MWENLWLTSKLIRGDENAENQNGTSSPSDGASCSESSCDFEALFNTGDSDKVFEVFKSFVKLLEKNRDIILPLKERFRAWACIAEMAAEGLDLSHLKSLKD